MVYLKGNPEKTHPCGKKKEEKKKKKKTATKTQRITLKMSRCTVGTSIDSQFTNARLVRVRHLIFNINTLIM